MFKRLFTGLLALLIIGASLSFFTACDDSKRDPDAEAYDK